MLSQRDPQRGFLCSVGLQNEILVNFQFNPQQLSDQRKVTYGALGAPGILLPVRQYSQGGDRRLSFTVRIDGLFEDPTDHTGTGGHGEGIARDENGGITPELNKYRAFLYPQNEDWDIATESFIPVYDSSRDFTSPPQALFGFGEGRVIDCIVTEMNITELLFNEKLAPLRADVAITLVEYDPLSDLPL